MLALTIWVQIALLIFADSHSHISKRGRSWLVSSPSPLTPHLCWVISVLFSLSFVQLMLLQAALGPISGLLRSGHRSRAASSTKHVGTGLASIDITGLVMSLDIFFVCPALVSFGNTPGSGVCKLFCRAERKYFRFCGPWVLYCNHSTLPL